MSGVRYLPGEARAALCTLLAGISLSFIPASAWSQECPELTVHERVRLSAVHDGDTLRLTDGRRVRLLAINAPELAIEGQAEQPLARASRQAVAAFFADTEFVHLSFESRRTDRYGRILAHVTHPSGRNLESYLVRQGLAVPLAVPPDLAFAGCLRDLAEQARREQKGIWQTEYWQPLAATQLHGVQEAFRLVCGRVEKVDRQRDIFVELNGDLVVRIARSDLQFFGDSGFSPIELERGLGRTLLVAGWLRDRSDQADLMRRGFKPWIVQARTPYALHWMDASDPVCE